MPVPETLVTKYLQITNRPVRVTLPEPPADTIVVPMVYPDTAYYRFLYREVGDMWRWRDRLLLDDAALQDVLSEAARIVHVLHWQGTPAGYVELHNAVQSVEIAYFGLRPIFFGKGLGKYLLEYAIKQAWRMGADVERVWLHTCNLDSPRALPNYVARGFVVYDVQETPMPEHLAQ